MTDREKFLNGLLTMSPLDTLEAIRKDIHEEDVIVVTADGEDSLVQLWWDHHDGMIEELAGSKKPTLVEAVIDFNVKWIEQERESERRRIADAGNPARPYSILPGLFRAD